MKLLILQIIISFKLLSVPYMHTKEGDFLHYKNIIKALHLRSKRKGAEILIEGGKIKITKSGRIYLKSKFSHLKLNGGYLNANSWAFLLSKITDSYNYYWDYRKKRLIQSRYPPSVKLVKLQKYRTKTVLVFSYNRDIKPVYSYKKGKLILSFPRGFIVVNPVLLKNPLLKVKVRHSLSGLTLIFTLKKDVKYRLKKERSTLSLIFVRSNIPKTSFPARGLVVIDPGHGGKDPGAIGYRGVREKDITLAIAREVKRIAEKKLGIKVILTRNRDVFIPLWERSKIANKLGASMFISIHCNYSRNRYAKGFETYFLSNARTKWERAVAALENASVKYEINYQKQYGMVRKILGDMAQNRYLKESQVLAEYIQESVVKKTGTFNRGIKQAGFYVLLFTHTPSILVETGFISNPREARRLKSRWYIRKIAEGIVDGIALYLNNYAGRNYTNRRG